MTKLTGQFTTPSFDENNDKTHKPFLHGVVFVFTGDEKITLESDDKGKYDFDLTNGEYEVSVYLKGSTEKDRFDMRAGEKFVVTATTQADALEKWLQVIGTSGKDELATYYENLLAQMQKVFDDFKDEANADGEGLFVKQSSVKRNALKDGGEYYSSTKIPPKLSSGDSGLCPVYLLLENNPGLDFTGLGITSAFIHFQVMSNYKKSAARLFCFFNGYEVSEIWVSSTDANGVWAKPSRLYGTANTTVDSNGNIKAASPIIKLFNDHIESNDSFKEKPSLEKLSTGVYKISNTLGLAKEGWYIETPKDKNGLPYFMVDWEQDEESHDVIIRVFKKKLDIETLDFVNGEPIDIGQDQRWIDLRFHEEPQGADDEELLTQLDNLDESAH